MRDENQNKGNENPNFDELIKELNSLLDRVPEIIETNKANVNISNSSSSSNSNLNEDITNPIHSKEDNEEEKKNFDDKLDNETGLIENENLSLNRDDEIKDLVIEANKEDFSQKEIKDIKEDLEISINEELLKIDEEKDLDVTPNEDDIKLANDEENLVEIDIENDLKISDLKIEEDFKINIDNIQNQIEEPSNTKIEKDISFEQPIDAITTEVDNVSKGSFTYSIISNDLEKLIYNKKPQNISDERVRKIGIIFASNDEKILRDFINFLDDISMSSKDKPMFVERSIFMIYDENFSSEAFLVSAQNEKINGVVLVGELPVDKIYELESSLSQLGCVFLNLKGEVSRSRVIDFVLDLIAV